MADVVVAPATNQGFRQYEFYAFSIVAFAAKSLLLIRLPYRPWYENILYTFALLSFLYSYFRFRQRLVFPLFVIFCLATAIGIDVLGNFFQLYGKPFGPLDDYDEFTHFFGSGFSLIPVMWLFRATTRRMGFRLPQAMVAFLSATITFSFCAWYEILELWDEKFYGGKRIWSLQDTANDLQHNLAGIVLFALLSSFFFKMIDRHEERDLLTPPPDSSTP